MLSQNILIHFVQCICIKSKFSKLFILLTNFCSLFAPSLKIIHRHYTKIPNFDEILPVRACRYDQKKKRSFVNFDVILQVRACRYDRKKVSLICNFFTIVLFKWKFMLLICIGQCHQCMMGRPDISAYHSGFACAVIDTKLSPLMLSLLQ